jgi:UDP-N-acetylmuramyl pentapeptide synthase
MAFLDYYKHNIDFESHEQIEKEKEEIFEIIPKKRRLLICDKNIEN